jgi:lipopolysaccharide/colanic/teichoic acid biosynthesis glycosyltransferase
MLVNTNRAGSISKPPPPDVGDRPRTTPQLVASMRQGAMVGSRRRNAPENGRPGQSGIWQIFGRMDCYDNSPDEEKVWITAYLLVI